MQLQLRPVFLRQDLIKRLDIVQSEGENKEGQEARDAVKDGRRCEGSRVDGRSIGQNEGEDELRCADGSCGLLAGLELEMPLANGQDGGRGEQNGWNRDKG